MRKVVLVLVLVSLLSLLAPAPESAHAVVTITFDVTDLPDVVPGEDLQQYSYRVSGFAFDTSFGFRIFFDPVLYGALEDPPPNADWTILILQPDPAIPDDGVYDAVAAVDGASLVDPFVVNFIWLGAPGTTPGSQPFTVNQFDQQGNLEILEEGLTVPAAAVPMPATLILTGLGLLGLAGLRRALRTRLSHRRS